MTPVESANLSSEINKWFDRHLKEEIPGPVMCEAFMMIPLVKWLLYNGFSEFKPEHWCKEKNQPYHAFDLRAERKEEEYLFDLKLFRGQRKFSWKQVGKDLSELGNMNYDAKYRYCVVTSEKSNFLFDRNGAIESCKEFLDNDDRRHIVVSSEEIVLQEGKDYTTMICRVRHESLNA